MRKVFVSWPGYSSDDPVTGERLIAAGYELVLKPKFGSRSDDELITFMQGCCAAIVSTDPFTRKAIASNPALRVIARVGVGTDSIDQIAANERGVAVCITPGLNSETVADQTLALILALIRKVIGQDLSVKAGRWERVGSAVPSELPGKTVGLVGAGTIGQAVMRRLSGFGANIVFFDTCVPAIHGAEKLESLDALLAVSDVVSLHALLTPQTRGLINAARLRLMKPTALLINTARGSLVDQQALFAALRMGSIAGAALDVFAEEPPDAAILTDVPNLVASAHIAGLSQESIRRMTVSATDSVLAVLGGKIPATVVNPSALDYWRSHHGTPT